MKFSDARPNVIRTFGLRIKQFQLLPTLIFQTFWKHLHILFYNIGASNHRRLCWIWCIYLSAIFHGNIRQVPLLFYKISMRLSDSVFVSTAEVWAIVKALEQIKESRASKFIIYTDSLSCLHALQYMKLEHPLTGMVIIKCVFLNLPIKIFFLLATQSCWR